MLKRGLFLKDYRATCDDSAGMETLKNKTKNSFFKLYRTIFLSFIYLLLLPCT